MRTSDQILHPSLRNEIIRTFAQTLSDINSPQEADDFLNDFFTDAELETFSKRLAIAYWLKKGRSYVNIKNNLKVSSATIATVVSMTKTTGFRLALKKMEAEEWATQWAEKIKRFIK